MTRSVWESTASILSKRLSSVSAFTKELRYAEPVPVSSTRIVLKMTSSAVISRPLWKLIPGRILKVQSV